MKIYLASNSPRRRELLKGLDLDFEQMVLEGIDESYPQCLPVEEVAEYICREKAAAYPMSDSLLITADTIVTIDGEILGKPHDAAEAHAMLRKLSGRTHKVITGVCLIMAQKQRSFSDITTVTFREISDEEIDYYISHYKPFDKAGAYGIQEWIGYVGITSIQGSFYNVMGLPVERVYEEIKKMEEPMP